MTKESKSLSTEIQDAATNSLLNIALEKYNAVLLPAGGTEILVSCSDDFTVYMWKPQESKYTSYLIQHTIHYFLIIYQLPLYNF